MWTTKTLQGVVAALWQTARGGLSGESKRRWSITPALSRRLPGLARIARSMWHLALILELAVEIRRERRMLSSLDDRALKDIGLNRGEADAEADRPFWDIPRADRTNLPTRARPSVYSKPPSPVSLRYGSRHQYVIRRIDGRSP